MYETGSVADEIYLFDNPLSTVPINDRTYSGDFNIERILINSNYLKIVFKTGDEPNECFGFRAIIVPNY